MPRGSQTSRRGRRSLPERDQQNRGRQRRTTKQPASKNQQTSSKPLWDDDEGDNLDLAMTNPDSLDGELDTLTLKGRNREARRQIELLREEKALQEALRDIYDY
jgi:hypothetical protein